MAGLTFSGFDQFKYRLSAKVTISLKRLVIELKNNSVLVSITWPTRFKIRWTVIHVKHSDTNLSFKEKMNSGKQNRTLYKKSDDLDGTEAKGHTL